MADITINGLTAVTSPATTDEVGIWDVGAGQYKKVTRANLIGATITGGGTIALGGFTLTVGATSTVNGSITGGGTVATAGFTLTVGATSTVTGSITGGGTVATGGFTLTVPATGAAALLATTNAFTAEQTIKGTNLIVSDINASTPWYIGRENVTTGNFQIASVGPVVRFAIGESSGNVKIAGTAVRGTTEGTNHIDIFNGTAPVGTLTNGISIYSSSGEGYMMDAAGNATLQTPHDENGLWVFDSKNTVTGRRLRVHMERMLTRLNEMFGWDFVEEFIEELA